VFVVSHAMVQRPAELPPFEQYPGDWHSASEPHGAPTCFVAPTAPPVPPPLLPPESAEQATMSTAAADKEIRRHSMSDTLIDVIASRNSAHLAAPALRRARSCAAGAGSGSFQDADDRFAFPNWEAKVIDLHVRRAPARREPAQLIAPFCYGAHSRKQKRAAVGAKAR
jgi:hypothetical protein